MRFDPDLARRILLWAESSDENYWGNNPQIEGYSDVQVAYHVLLLHEAGYVIGMGNGSFEDGRYSGMHLARLTYQGHQFIEKSRADSVWEQIKYQAREKTGNLSMMAIGVVMEQMIVSQFFKPPG